MSSLNRPIANLFGKVPLRVLLVVPFVVQIAVAVGLTGYLSFRNGQEAVEDLAGQLQEEITDRIRERLNTYLYTPHLINRISADDVKLGKLDLNDPIALERHFWRQIQTFPDTSYIYMGTSRGLLSGAEFVPGKLPNVAYSSIETPDRNFETYVTNNRGDRAELLSVFPDYNLLTRPWYKAGKQAGKPTWGDIYVWVAPYENLALPALTPVYGDRGDLEAVFAVDLSLLAIGDFLQTLEIGKTGETFIIERDGLLVASSTKDLPFLQENDEPKRIKATDSSNLLISATARYLRNRFDDFDRIEKTQQLAFKLEGKRQLLQVTPYQDEFGLDWLIVVAVPEVDFMARIHANTRTTALLCFIALIIAIAVGILTSRWICQGIFSLNEAAKKLSAGNWDRAVPVERSNELGELAQSFNTMAIQLQESFQKLESQNAELQRLDRLKNEFLANTSHELRTPLNGMIGITESMLEGATGRLTNLQRKNLVMVSQSGHRLANLVNDILDFSKLRHNNIELKLKSIGMREIVEVVLNLHQVAIASKDLKLVNAIPPNLPNVNADENRLQQILHNLVGNAIKFTNFGRVEISAKIKQLKKDSSPPSFLEITVADTGIGIPEDKVDRIFESFEQADGSTAREYGGTGLGLTITKQLIELHDGTIRVESVINRGSKFIFTLPVAKKTREENDREWKEREARRTTSVLLEEDLSSAEPIISTEAIQERQFTVLIVDDEPVNLQVLVNYLAFENYAIVQANNGWEALDAIENGLQPDLILLDVMMPRMTGYEVCQKLREKYLPNELPILMLTAKNQVSDLVEGLNSGANDYLTKPISKSELLARIKTHLQLSYINQAYSRFVPRQFLEFLKKETILDVNLGDQIQQDMSVLFADIRNFTTLSEKLSPEENFKFINSYLAYMEPSITENNGFIDKYIGDEIMALFGGTADDALKAGISILDRLNDYNADRDRNDQNKIRIGIGINTGSFMLGIVGGSNRMDGTAIGDTVNLASRLEQLTKEYSINLVISHHTLAALKNPIEYNFRFIDKLKVKGKDREVAIFEVLDGDDPKSRELKISTSSRFEEGILFYWKKSYAEAAQRFEECLKLNAGDLVARLYLQRCSRYLK
ncbi:MAG: response regulator [Cyanobacteria bacterium SBLK]|nr:response regulator [Cyanobacteria bacterium SBLK]